MPQRFLVSTLASPTRSIGHAAGAAALALVTLATLSACGGGGGSSGPTATVTSTSVTPHAYSKPALVTVNGTNLDASLSVSSPYCINMTRMTSGIYASTSTTAYYSCRVTGGTHSTVTVKSNGTTVGGATWSVPQPVVVLSVTNGLGVNGNITMTLDADKAPLTVDNLLDYVNSGFYNGLIFHRVVPGFIMQAGGYGPTVNGQLPAPARTGAGIPVENTGLSNVQWSVAMANTGAAGPNTTSQFYFNLVDNTSLDGGYAVFGAITAGIDVAQAIVAAPANCVANPAANTTDCLPQPDVVISTATQTL